MPSQVDRKVRGWRVGIPIGEYFFRQQPAMASAFENTLKLLRDFGCQLIDFDPPGIEAMYDLTIPIIQAEGSAYHERYREREQLYGSNFRERILPGRELKALKYLTARRLQLELQQDWLEVANQFDVLVVPSGPAVAPPHGATTIEIGGERLPFRAVLSRFTRPFSLLGWPALTVPNAITTEGLPTGVQIVGPPDSELRLFILGYQIEKTLGLIPKLDIEPRVTG